MFRDAGRHRSGIAVLAEGGFRRIILGKNGDRFLLGGGREFLEIGDESGRRYENVLSTNAFNCEEICQ